MKLKETLAELKSKGNEKVRARLSSYVIKNHPDKETLRQKWMADDDPLIGLMATFSPVKEETLQTPNGIFGKQLNSTPKTQSPTII